MFKYIILFLFIPINVLSDDSLVYSKVNNLKINIWYSSSEQETIKTTLLKPFFYKKTLINNSEIAKIFISGTDGFCMEDFVIIDSVTKKPIKGIVLLYNNSNEVIIDTCHTVDKFSYGFIFVPSVDNIHFKYKYTKIRFSDTM